MCVIIQWMVNQNGVIDVFCVSYIRAPSRVARLLFFPLLFVDFILFLFRSLSARGFCSLFCFIVCENMMNHCRNYRPYIMQANKNYVALFDCDARNLIRLLSFIVESSASEWANEWVCVWRSTRTHSHRIYRLNGHTWIVDPCVHQFIVPRIFAPHFPSYVCVSYLPWI